MMTDNDSMTESGDNSGETRNEKFGNQLAFTALVINF